MNSNTITIIDSCTSIRNNVERCDVMLDDLEALFSEAEPNHNDIAHLLASYRAISVKLGVIGDALADIKSTINAVDDAVSMIA